MNVHAKVLTTSIGIVHTVAETGEVRDYGTVTNTHHFLAPVPPEHCSMLGLGPEHIGDDGLMHLEHPTPEQTALLQSLGYIPSTGG